MTSLFLELQAREPKRHRFRAYEVIAGQDLFGAWLVQMRYGRIGAMGRTKSRSFGTQKAAAEQITACLRRRATAPHRIGTSYLLRHAAWRPEWDDAGFADLLSSFAAELRFGSR